MVAKRATVEDLQAFADQLDGPLGFVLGGAGAIMARRLEQRGKGYGDLSDGQLIDLFHAAFLDAAPPANPQVPRDALERDIDNMFADIRMQLAATVEGPDRLN